MARSRPVLRPGTRITMRLPKPRPRATRTSGPSTIRSRRYQARHQAPQALVARSGAVIGSQPSRALAAPPVLHPARLTRSCEHVASLRSDRETRLPKA
jgi:hypothetical protein